MSKEREKPAMSRRQFGKLFAYPLGLAGGALVGHGSGGWHNTLRAVLGEIPEQGNIIFPADSSFKKNSDNLLIILGYLCIAASRRVLETEPNQHIQKK